jgi:endonuclease/exonuclease/phosphatase family metal-dependent hydrolase
MQPAFLLLAAVLIAGLVAFGVAPAEADSKGKGPPVTVMTRNLYLGADLSPVFEAAQENSFEEVVKAVTTAYRDAMASDIPTRASAVADEIAASKPHLVGLQEAVVWTSLEDPEKPVSTNFVQLLLQELAARGQQYEAVAVATGFNVALPTALGYPVSLVMSDVILARTDLPPSSFSLTNVQTANYGARIQFAVETPAGLQVVEIPRQWASVDVTLHGKSFRFISTHLESAVQIIRVLQAGELMGVMEVSDLPVVLVGDLNAELNVVDDSSWLLTTYGGLADVWSASHRKDPGLTCCQDPSLWLPVSTLVERIDFVMTKGDFNVINAHVVGDEWIADPTGVGYPVFWASDHAGVTAKLSLPRSAD